MADHSFYRHLDPLPQRVAKVTHGRAFVLPQIIEPASLRRTPFYNEFLVPHAATQTLGMGAPILGEGWMGVGIRRAERDLVFDERDMGVLDLIAPHLIKAFEVHRASIAHHADHAAMHLLLEGLGLAVAVVKPPARLLWANGAMTGLLKTEAGLRDRSGVLAASVPGETRALRAAIASAAQIADGALAPARSSVLVSRARDLRPLVVTIIPVLAQRQLCLPVPARVLVVARAPGSATPIGAKALCAAYGLTKAEARLAAMIADGLSLRAVSERLHITIGTARNHLKRIFIKTDTHRQAELVRLLMMSVPGL